MEICVICGQKRQAAGWAARLELGLEQRTGRTLLASKRGHGPLSVQRSFYPEGGVCHLYLRTRRGDWSAATGWN